MAWDKPFDVVAVRRLAKADVNRTSAEDIVLARLKLAARSKATVVVFGVAKSIGCLLGCTIFSLIGLHLTYHGGFFVTVLGSALVVICGLLALLVLLGCFLDNEIKDWHRARRELRPKWINDIEDVYTGTV